MLFEVKYTVYNNRDYSSYDPSLWNCSQTIQANSAYQAQAMIEAQFNGCAVVSSVMQVN